MNSIVYVPGRKKNHQIKMTKTLETNVTSDKGEEKSKSNSQTSNQNNILPKNKTNIFLLQYQKYFNKKLVIKYNILPNEYTLMKLDNFITAKYCHSLASFKEKLIFNYDEEFLNRFYTKRESKKQIPLFSEFYKSYLKFFCFPTLAEIRLNDLIEDMVEKKAKAFYNENFTEKDKNEKNEKKINVVIFTNKIRQDISRRNSLTNLTKTTIKNKSITNKSSISLVTIEKLFNEMNNEKKGKIAYNSNNNLRKDIGGTNKELKDSNITSKMKKIIKNYPKDKNDNNIDNKIKIKNNITDSSGKRKKIKNKISRNIQNAILENKASSSIRNPKIKTIQKNIRSILKINSKINLNNYIYSPLDNQKISTISKNNLKNNINEKTKQNGIKYKQPNNNMYKNYCKTLNNNYNIKNNSIISNFKNNTLIDKLKNFSNNFNTHTNNNTDLNYIINKTVSNSKNNSKRNINKNTIKVIQKPSQQKIKQIRQIKSRNCKNNINDLIINVYNVTTQSKNDLNFKNISRENISDYYTINNKNLNTVSIKISNQRPKPKIKLIKAENKTNTNNNRNNTQNNNVKVFNYITARKKNTNYFVASNFKKSNGSSSSSLKNINEKNLILNGNINCNAKRNINSNINSNIRKNKVIDSKNNLQINSNSYASYDSQKKIKNSKSILNDYKIKITKKTNEPSPHNDIKKIKLIKSYCKK
jgi:hypothetical protein